LEAVLNTKSGLLGVSGISDDVRDLELEAENGCEPALLALEMFAYRARKYIGSYVAALGGLDGIAFCGGIGENNPAMRARICSGLEFMQIRLDEKKNRSAPIGQACRISSGHSGVPVWVIPTNEELQIARDAYHAQYAA
jgi:acetate kinase